MARGLVGFGRQTYLDQARSGFSTAGNMEQQRAQANRRMEQAERQNTMQMAGMGASTGAMVGGPVGAVIGGGAGLLAGELF